MDDYLIKATAANGKVRAYIERTTNLVSEAFKTHQTSVCATAAIGRLLTASSLMGSMLKNEGELITLSLKGDGPLKGVVATSDCTANAKGYVFAPYEEIPLRKDGKIDVAGAIGKGTLTVIKDLGLKEPYVGNIDLISGEIAEDVAYYFHQSEQTPSAVALGVLIDRDYSVKASGGYIIQLLPDADEALIEKLEENIKNAPPITSLLEQHKTPEDILELILGEFGVIINEKQNIYYKCNCSKERVEKALISVGLKELETILVEDKKATLHCHFCCTDYHFTENEIENLVDSLKLNR